MSEKLSSNTKFKLFGDDSLLYRQIKEPSDAIALQKDVNTQSAWEIDWKTSFHPHKCQVISFSPHKSLRFDYEYSIPGTILERSENAKYLGVILNS